MYILYIAEKETELNWFTSSTFVASDRNKIKKLFLLDIRTCVGISHPS